MPDVEETVVDLTLTQFIEQRLPKGWVVHEHREQRWMDDYQGYPVTYIEESGTGGILDGIFECKKHKGARIVDFVIENLDNRLLRFIQDGSAAYERKYQVKISVRVYRNEKGEIIPPHHPYLP